MIPTLPGRKAEVAVLSALPTVGEEDRLWREIHALEEHAQEQFASCEQLKGECVLLKVGVGDRLNRLKEITDHGKFMKRAKEEMGWSHRFTTLHMELAREYPKWNNCSTFSPTSIDPKVLIAEGRAALRQIEAGGMETGVPAKPERLRFALTFASGARFDLEYREDSLQGSILLAATAQGQQHVILTRA